MAGYFNHRFKFLKRMTMTPTRYDLTIGKQDPAKACEALARHTGLSKSRIKQAMIKGAVWLKRPKHRQRRLRRAAAIVKPEDHLVFYYDPAILELQPPRAQCLSDKKQYSIWFKPAGLMTQGTRFGDHCALLRQVEHHFQMKRKVFLVHRLDREAAGVIMVAHSRRAAALLSELFRSRNIEKQYNVWVRGRLTTDRHGGVIDLPLDAKAAATEFHPIRYDEKRNQTLVNVRIHTGRRHQIRRHFDLIGHPVMGDPRYGEGNKTRKGLQLAACSLCFQCPFSNQRVEVNIDPQEFGLL